MRRGLIIDFNNVAAMLAHEDAKVQATFFNTFARELSISCETHFATEMQCVHIAADLTKEAKEACKAFCYEEN